MYYTRFILGLLVAAPAAAQDVQSWNTLLVQLTSPCFLPPV